MNCTYLRLPLARHLVAAAATVASLFFLPSAHANTAVRADPASGTYASQIYWMDWTGLAAPLLTGPGTQAYSFTLADGSTLTLDLTRGGTSTVPIEARTAPTIPVLSAMGNQGYTGFNGANVALNSVQGNLINGTISFTLSNIVLTNPANVPVPNFEIVMADAEILDSVDGASGNITFTTTGGSWSSLERVPATGGLVVTLSGLGTQTAVQPAATGAGGPGVVVPSWILSSAKPASGAFTVGADITSNAAQGIMLGIRMGTVRLNKNIGARVNASDQFVYRIKNASGASVGEGPGACAAVGDCTTTGATTGSQIQISAAIANGNTVTLEEVMASGSVGTLNDYAKTIACTNTNTGSSTTLPSGAYTPASPPQITLTSAVDDISCVITNSVSADMRASSATTQTVSPGTPTTVVTSCTNAGPQSAANASCGVAVTGYPGAITTCSPTSPQTSLASGASMACTTTFTPTSAGTVTLTTTAGSATSDPTPGNNTATSTVNVSVSAVLTPQPDTSAVPPNTPVTIPVIGNDGPATGNPLDPTSVTVVTPPANGSVTCSAAGSCTYTPATGFTGTDSFVYRVCDTSLTPVCGNATVTVRVGNVAAVPVNSRWMLLLLATLLTFAAGVASLRSKSRSR